jgi:dolichol-phosphate mannosyltransferase
MGRRVNRQDKPWRTRVSKIAGWARQYLLKDSIPDSGCGLKIISKRLYMALPYFDHMHRFMPTLVARAQGTVASIPIQHRARGAGHSNYGLIDRTLAGFLDIMGVWWLKKRYKKRIVVD